MTRPLRRLVADARTLGTLAALRSAPGWLLRPTYVGAVTTLHDPLPPVPPGIEVQLLPLRERDMADALAIDPRLSPAAIRRRLAAGEECVLVWHEGRATHCVWWTDHPVFLTYLGRRFRPLPGDRLCVDVTSRPAHRRRGIDAAAAIAYLHRLRDLGYRRALSLIASWNRPALGVALGRMHGQAAGTVGYWNLGVARRYVVSGGVRLDANGQVFIAAAEAAGVRSGPTPDQ